MNIPFLLKPKSQIAFLYDFNTLRQGLEKMKAHGYTAIPVLGKDGNYVGTVSEGDFLWHMIGNDSGRWKEQEEYSIKDILRPDWNGADFSDNGGLAVAGYGSELRSGCR